MRRRCIKIHRKRYEMKKHMGIVTHIRVYRNEGKNLVAVHPFLMSNLEGILTFFIFLVNSLWFRITVKILVEVIQFPVKVSGFFLSRFIGFL